MTCPPCNGHCHQGRDCPARIEEHDEPPITPDQAERWTGTAVLIVIFSILCVLAIVCGAKLDIPFSR